jgi:AcrR family transcriptional regulator
MTRPYHHGDLANALLAAVEEIVLERGPTGVTLREAARRAGVSHSAPAHHFGDKDGMIGAFADVGFGLLGERLMAEFTAVVDRPVREQLGAMGRAYLRFAAEHPAHYEVMMGPRGSQGESTAGRKGPDKSSEGAFLPLALLVNRLGEEGVVDPEQGRYVATMLWGMVHGIADLWLAGILPHFYEDHSYEQLVDAAVDQLVALVLPGE